jgi:hypothetical protein
MHGVSMNCPGHALFRFGQICAACSHGVEQILNECSENVVMIVTKLGAVVFPMEDEMSHGCTYYLKFM